MMSLQSPQNLQAAIAVLCASLAATASFCLTKLFSGADIPRSLLVTLCALTALMSAFGAIALWRFSYPASDNDWSDGEEDELEHDFTRVRFTGFTRPGVPRDHLRVVSRDDADDP